MLKSIVWFVLGSALTLIFFGVMLFILGQSQRVICKHTGAGAASCTVTSTLLGVVPLSGWTLDNVVTARVQDDCNDGCTYRTALVTDGGAEKPVNEVWTDQEDQDRALAAQIDAFVHNAEAPTLVADMPAATWLIALLVGLAAMSFIIQGIVLVANVARGLFGGRPAIGSGGYQRFR
jgi:hypothetical protein